MHKALLISVLVCLSLIASVRANAYFTIAHDKDSKNKHIHVSYFRTPHNANLKVRARLYGGHFKDQFCIRKTALNNIGVAKVRTGATLAFDPEKLKAIIGGGLDCLVMLYQHERVAIDTIQLMWDGSHYVATRPVQTQVVIR